MLSLLCSCVSSEAVLFLRTGAQPVGPERSSGRRAVLPRYVHTRVFRRLSLFLSFLSLSLLLRPALLLCVRPYSKPPVGSLRRCE